MKKYLALLLAGLMIFSLVACGKQEAKTEELAAETTEKVEETPVEEAKEVEEYANKLEAIKATGKLIMGTNAGYPPFEFHKMIDGEDKILGFDIFIAEELAKDLGVELEIQDIEFSAVLAGMETGLVDVGIAGITKTAEREKSMDFSDIYYTSQYTTLVKAGDEGKYCSPEKMTEAKARVGVQTATVQEALAETIEGIEIISIAKTPDLVSQLKSGYIDAMLTEQSVADLYAAQNEDLASDQEPEFEKSGLGAAIAVQKGQVELVEEINKTIKRLQDEGLMEEFYQKALEIAAQE